MLKDLRLEVHWVCWVTILNFCTQALELAFHDFASVVVPIANRRPWQAQLVNVLANTALVYL
eukprot:11657945-Karenia_brevis.AAC.1